MLLFLKASAINPDLFSTVVPVQGYTNAHGHFVAPHQARRSKRTRGPALEMRRPPAPLEALGDDWLIGQSDKACVWCGEPERVEVHEAWGHDFMLDCCCETRQQQAVEDMQDNPEYGRQLLAGAGMDVRRVAFTGDGHGDVLLDFHPEVRPIGREEAQAFVAWWHRHNDPLPADQWRFGIWNGGTMLGVVVGGAPTARGYNDAFQRKELCEVRRVCVRTDLPNELTWKACSMLYRAAELEAEKRGFRKVITYTRADEGGMSLRYARWKQEAEVTDKGSRRKRDGDERETSARVRWSKRLHPSHEAAALPAAPVVAARQDKKSRQFLLFKPT